MIVIDFHSIPSVSRSQVLMSVLKRLLISLSRRMCSQTALQSSLLQVTAILVLRMGSKTGSQPTGNSDILTFVFLLNCYINISNSLKLYVKKTAEIFLS